MRRQIRRQATPTPIIRRFLEYDRSDNLFRPCRRSPAADRGLPRTQTTTARRAGRAQADIQCFQIHRRSRLPDDQLLAEHNRNGSWSDLVEDTIRRRPAHPTSETIPQLTSDLTRQLDGKTLSACPRRLLRIFWSYLASGPDDDTAEPTPNTEADAAPRKYVFPLAGRIHGHRRNRD